MATEIQRANDIKSQDFNYKSRGSYFNQINHLNDNFLNMGYNYRGKLYRKTTSPELWSNPLQYPFIGRLESLMVFLIENVKYIKKTFSIAHDKETLNIR